MLSRARAPACPFAGSRAANSGHSHHLWPGTRSSALNRVTALIVVRFSKLAMRVLAIAPPPQQRAGDPRCHLATARTYLGRSPRLVDRCAHPSGGLSPAPVSHRRSLGTTTLSVAPKLRATVRELQRHHDSCGSRRPVTSSSLRAARLKLVGEIVCGELLLGAASSASADPRVRR